MFKLSYEQAKNLARILKERDLQASVPQHHYSRVHYDRILEEAPNK